MDTKPPRKVKLPGSSHERLFTALTIVITTIWAAGTIVQLIYPNRPVPQTLNYVMIAVAGSFFGGSMLSRRNGGSSK